MKDINKIKIKINMYKNRYLIYFSFLIVLLFLTIKVLPYINIPTNTTVIGIAGTLLGATVGGIFTLIGSIYVNNRQLTANFEIKRKNTIYRPLYDELADINNILLKENPYPIRIAFEKGEQTIVRHPQFDAWKRIKSDSRILETPRCLKEQYNKMMKSIIEYSKIRFKLNEPIKEVLNEELYYRFGRICSISNIGDVISSEILENKTDKHFLKPYIVNPMSSDKELSDMQIAELEQSLYNKCNELQEIKDVRKAYGIWLEEQNKTIELLENLIIEIAIKYEKQRS